MKLPLLDRFEEACADMKIHPMVVLKASGADPSLWWKWKSRKVSPTLRKFEAAVVALESMGGSTCECGGACKGKRRKT